MRGFIEAAIGCAEILTARAREILGPSASELKWVPIEDVELSQSIGRKVVHFELDEGGERRALLTDDLDGSWTLILTRDGNAIDVQTGFVDAAKGCEWYAERREALWANDAKIG